MQSCFWGRGNEFGVISIHTQKLTPLKEQLPHFLGQRPSAAALGDQTMLSGLDQPLWPTQRIKSLPCSRTNSVPTHLKISTAGTSHHLSICPATTFCGRQWPCSENVTPLTVCPLGADLSSQAEVPQELFSQAFPKPLAVLQNPCAPAHKTVLRTDL